jgi:hypothetical protein
VAEIVGSSSEPASRKQAAGYYPHLQRETAAAIPSEAIMSWLVRATRPRILLKVEYAALAVLAVTLYAREGESWWLFAVLVLAPDLAFIGMLGGQEAGAATYNLTHLAAWPAILAFVGVLGEWDLPVSLALVWFTHIAVDRAIGYGFKYSLAKGNTHLDRV